MLRFDQCLYDDQIRGSKLLRATPRTLEPLRGIADDGILEPVLEFEEEIIHERMPYFRRTALAVSNVLRVSLADNYAAQEEELEACLGNQKIVFDREHIRKLYSVRSFVDKGYAIGHIAARCNFGWPKGPEGFYRDIGLDTAHLFTENDLPESELFLIDVVEKTQPQTKIFSEAIGQDLNLDFPDSDLAEATFVGAVVSYNLICFERLRRNEFLQTERIYAIRDSARRSATRMWRAHHNLQAMLAASPLGLRRLAEARRHWPLAGRLQKP